MRAKNKRARLLALALSSACLCACDRQPLETICPTLAPGDLVVTELRGPQTGADTYGQWIELYNASGAPASLAGLTIQFVRIDGGDDGVILVRDHDLTVAAGAYVVLGRRDPASVPAYMSYGYLPDFDRDFFASAAVRVSACGLLVDEMIYRSLPGEGTWSFSGALDPPSASANDDENNWCADPTVGTDPNELGLPGSPQQRNRPC